MARATHWLPALALLFGSAAIATEQPPLTDKPGNANRGRAVFLDRQRGHCLLCHQYSAVDEGFQGNIGPSLDGVGNQLSAAALRYRLVDSTRLNPQTVMPAYHRQGGFRDVAPAFRNRPVLTAQEIEDLIAFLRAGGS
ncbi:MAG: sulfur oxidation c-type cytochrome SoxX [Pseudomonadota bacterium]